MISLTRTTKFEIPSGDWFDLEVLKSLSNQPDGPGYFTMQVRRVQVGEWTMPWRNGEWSRHLAVEGRRYKADGSLGRYDARGTVNAADLPPEIWVAIRDEVPAELHPGGGR